MSFFKPFTTLAVGMALGYFVLPKVMAKVGG
jgi:hypothetical protein